MPAGRPSSYKPAYCEEVISLMAEGYSLTACAGALGVSRQTIYEWRLAHPEFAYSVSVGEAKRLWWWESKSISNAGGAVGNAGMIQFGLKNVGAQDWREKIEIDQTVTTKAENIDYSNLDSDEVATLRDLLTRAKAGKADVVPVQATTSKANGATRH